METFNLIMTLVEIASLLAIAVGVWRLGGRITPNPTEGGAEAQLHAATGQLKQSTDQLAQSVKDHT